MFYTESVYVKDRKLSGLIKIKHAIDYKQKVQETLTAFE